MRVKESANYFYLKSIKYKTGGVNLAGRGETAARRSAVNGGERGG